MKLKTFSSVLSITYLFSLFVFLLPVSVLALDFSKPLAGDTRCGGGTTSCSVMDIFPELKDVFIMAIVVIAFFAIVAFIWTGVRGLTADNQSAVLKSTTQQAWVIVSSILIAIFLVGGLAMAFWKSFVKPGLT